jgi:hypothetical protein
MRSTTSPRPVLPRPGRLTALALVAAALLAALTTIPHAAASPEDDEREELRVELNLFLIAVLYTKQDGLGNGDYSRPPSRCLEVVAGLKRLGMKPDDIMDGREPYPFRDAGARCREYAEWYAFVGPARAVAGFQTDMEMYTRTQVGDPMHPAELSDRALARAAECTKVVEDGLAAGASPTMKLAIIWGQPPMTLGEARAKICEPMATWARAFGPAQKAALEAMRKAARERYTKFGAAGDRLEWLQQYDSDGQGSSWPLPGCRHESDPKKLAKAPVLMKWWTADDGTVTLHRLQFKGNKLAKQTRRWFINEGAAWASGCK